MHHCQGPIFIHVLPLQLNAVGQPLADASTRGIESLTVLLSHA
jgi:hypothetical protein